MRAGLERTSRSLRSHAQTSPAAYRNEEALSMWIALFSIVIGVSLGLGLGALVLDTHGEKLGL